MRRTKGMVTLVAAVSMVAAMGAAPAAAEQDTTPGLPVYVALGDSWAWGQGAADPAVGGYAPQLWASLQSELDCLPAQSETAADGCSHLQFVNLGRPASPGLPGVTAPLVAAEQLPVAIPMLEARNQDHNPRNDVEVITLHVGGNDVSGPIREACIGGFTPSCLVTFVTEMTQYEADLTEVVGQLRAAAGPDTPIVLGTYDNPVPYCPLGGIPGAAQLGALVLEGTPDGSLDGVHDIVRRVAASYEAEVAEVFGTFTAADHLGDCLHPTDSGHDKVTVAFLDALGL
jgi:lysophospholipase L1-like esterase